MLFGPLKRPGGVLFVKNVKRRQADVGDFFLMKTGRDLRIGALLGNIRCWPTRPRGRGAGHGQRQPHDTDCRQSVSRALLLRLR